MQSFYHSEVKKFYNINQLESILKGTNIIYNKAVSQKNLLNSFCKTLVSHYREQGNYARDISNIAHLHTNKIIIELSEKDGTVVLNISHLPKLIGFYYYHPLYKTESKIVGVDNIKNLSFFPFTNLQVDMTNDIINYINPSCLNYNLFNNIFANNLINEVIIDGTLQEETTLFQVIFDTNFIGIL